MPAVGQRCLILEVYVRLSGLIKNLIKKLFGAKLKLSEFLYKKKNFLQVLNLDVKKY